MEIYGEAAMRYLRAGWSPLPVPRGQKAPVPEGWTGGAGHWAGSADVMAWAETCAEWNIALRTPVHVIGADVDDYGGKMGGLTLQRRTDRWGPLPETAISTSRPGTLSGIRFYRVTPGLSWPGQFGPGIDVVRFGHRYAMAPPSIHPEGREYVWAGTGEPESVDDLPELPEAWLMGMTNGGEPETVRPSGLLDPQLIGYWLQRADGPGVMCRHMGRLTRRELEGGARFRDGGARHDWMTGAVYAVIAAAAEGHHGVRASLRAISARWEALIASDRARDPGEWSRAVDGAVRKAFLIEPDGVRPEDPCPAPWIGPAAEPTTPRAGGETAGEAPAAGAEDPNLARWRELFGETEREPEAWLVEELIPAGARCTMLWSRRSGDGKTLLTWELVAAMARGRPIWGRHVASAIKVVVLDYENSPAMDLVPRLEAMGLTPEDMANVLLVDYAGAGLPPLDTPEGGLAVLKLAQDFGGALVVIDTSPRAVEGGENDADTWTAFDRCTIAVLRKAGISSLKLDQSGKDPAKGPRGSKAKVEGVDLDWELSVQADGSRLLKAGKARMPLDRRELLLRPLPEAEGLGHVPAPDQDPSAAKVAQIIAYLDSVSADPQITVRGARLLLKDAPASVPRGQGPLARAVRERQHREGVRWEGPNGPE